MWVEALVGAKVCVSMPVCARECVGGCVGAEESRGLRWKEGEEILCRTAEEREGWREICSVTGASGRNNMVADG